MQFNIFSTRNECTNSSPVDFLSLHVQMRQLQTPLQVELTKLLTLKDEIGELSASDETRLRRVREEIERSLLETADVICTTCVGAGDPRLRNFRYVNTTVTFFSVL